MAKKDFNFGWGMTINVARVKKMVCIRDFGALPGKMLDLYIKKLKCRGMNQEELKIQGAHSTPPPYIRS